MTSDGRRPVRIGYNPCHDLSQFDGLGPQLDEDRLAHLMALFRPPTAEHADEAAAAPQMSAQPATRCAAVSSVSQRRQCLSRTSKHCSHKAYLEKHGERV